MDDEFRLAQMKRAVRDAMPSGAGDFTVTAIARAAMAVADQWLEASIEEERDAARLDAKDAADRRDL